MLIRLSSILIASLLAVGLALAEEWIGQIKTLSGAVMLIRDNREHSAKLGDAVAQHDSLSTGPDGRIGITFIDNSRFSAGPNTRIELERFHFDPTTHEGEFITEIKQGTLAISSGQMAKQSKEAMKIKTPTTILGVRGTRFVVEVKD